VRAQAKRIERSLISVSFEEASGVVSWQDTIVRGSFQGGAENEIMAVELSETFFKAIKDRPVPVSEAAIRALGEQSLAIDLYLWLAYRLHVLERPISLSWAALHSQFGGGVNHYKAGIPALRRGARAGRGRPAFLSPRGAGAGVADVALRHLPRE
jgi:hypothetical protein